MIAYIKKNKLRSFILLLFYLIPTLCFFYGDVNANVRQGMNVWKALFSGHFFQYYSVNIESVASGEMEAYANYEMFLNVLNGIWQLPLYLIEKIAGIKDILSYLPARIWGSLLTVLFAFLSGWQMRGLGRELGVAEDNCEDLYFAYMTGALLAVSACIVGQLDIVGLTFFMAALQHRFRGDEKGFLTFSTMAVQCKSFCFFLYLPLILLKDKRVDKVIIKSILPLLVSWAIQLPFSVADPAGAAQKRPRMWFQLDLMTRSRVSMLGVEIPILFLALGAIVMAAYHIDMRDKEREWALWFSFAGMLPILILTNANPQWMLYMYPFAILLIFQRKGQLGRRLLYEMAGTLSLICGLVVEYARVFDETNMEGMLPHILLPQAVARGMLTRIAAWLQQEKYFYVWTLSYAAFVVWAVGMLYYYYPGRARQTAGGADRDWMDERVSLLLYLRALVAFLLCNAAVWLLFI